MRFDEHFLRNALPEVSFVQTIFPDDMHIFIDSRKLKQGDIFIALKVLYHDGHDFIAEALEKGAAGIIIAACKKRLFKTY